MNTVDLIALVFILIIFGIVFGNLLLQTLLSMRAEKKF